MSQNIFLTKLMTKMVLPTHIAFELIINDPLWSWVKKWCFLKIFFCATDVSIVSDIGETSKRKLMVFRTGVIIVSWNACILLISVLFISHSHQLVVFNSNKYRLFKLFFLKMSLRRPEDFGARKYKKTTNLNCLKDISVGVGIS